MLLSEFQMQEEIQVLHEPLKASDLLKRGRMTYFSIVSVLPAVDGCWARPQFGETDRRNSKLSTAMDQIIKKSIIGSRVSYIKNIFAALTCRQSALFAGKLNIYRQ